MTEKLSAEQQKLITDRVGLAAAIAHKEWLKLSGYERDDVVSWANQGLVAAAARWPAYCTEHGYEMYSEVAQSWFNTYASRRIHGSIIDNLRSSDVATRKERATVKSIRAAGVDLYSPWERDSPRSISEATGIPLAEVSSAISALLRVPVSSEVLEEAAQRPGTANVEAAAMEAALCARVVSAVRSLPLLHQRILLMSRYYRMSDEEIVRAIPELRQDPVSARHAVAWVNHFREQARLAIVEVLKSALIEDNDERLPDAV